MEKKYSDSFEFRYKQKTSIFCVHYDNIAIENCRAWILKTKGRG
jgi:hypothetical protein